MKEDSVKYAGTDVDFEWRNVGQNGMGFISDLLKDECKKIEEKARNTVPVSGTIEYDGAAIARVTDIEFDSSSLRGTGTPIYFNRINCTHNNYKRNKKALIL